MRTLTSKNKTRWCRVNRINRLRGYIWLILLLPILLCVLMSFGQKGYILGHKAIIILSDSMQPTIKTGGIVIVRSTSYTDIVIGDIIMYERDGINIVHRVVDKDDINEFLATKGDANMVLDYWLVPYSTVKGEVVGVTNIFSAPLSYIIRNRDSFSPGFESTTKFVLVLSCILAYYVIRFIIRFVIGFILHLINIFNRGKK